MVKVPVYAGVGVLVETLVIMLVTERHRGMGESQLAE